MSWKKLKNQVNKNILGIFGNFLRLLHQLGHKSVYILGTPVPICYYIIDNSMGCMNEKHLIPLWNLYFINEKLHSTPKINIES